MGGWGLHPPESAALSRRTPCSDILGFVDPSLVTDGATISAQLGGAPVRATLSDATGRFELYPVMPGTYDLVITASGRVRAVMTGVPVAETTSAVIGSAAARLNGSISASTATASGVVAVGGDPGDTGGVGARKADACRRTGHRSRLRRGRLHDRRLQHAAAWWGSNPTGDSGTASGRTAAKPPPVANAG